MVIKTVVTLGTRETPNFVSYEFFDAVKFMCAVNAYDVTFLPNTIRYFVPAHQVIERVYPQCQEYIVSVDDANLQPTCERRNTLKHMKWKHKTPNATFDRIKVKTVDVHHEYFLMLPNAGFYHTEIVTDVSISHLLYQGVIFTVHFRRIFTDPHDTSHSIWFYGSPKYQIEVQCDMDLRGNTRFLCRALTHIIPRAFKLDSMFGNQLYTS